MVRRPSSGSLAALLLAASVVSASADPVASVSRSDRTGVSVRIAFDSAESEVLGEGEWQRVRIDGLGSLGVPLWPDVPAHSVHIGVPPDVIVTGIRAEATRLERRGGPPIVPLNAPMRDAAGAPAIGAGWTEGSPPFPERWASLAEVGWWRNRRVAVVDLYPLRTIPGEGGYDLAREITLTLSFAPGRLPARKPLPARYGDDPMDPMIDAVLVNGSHSREWLRSERPAPLGRSGVRRGTSDYFSSASTWMKIRTRGEGILRVTGAALAAGGATMPIADASSIRVFRGPARELDFDIPADWSAWLEEVAIRVEDGGDGDLDPTSGDRIELYAQSVDGFANDIDPSGADSSYTMHQYTGERVYYLAWGGGFVEGAPSRMTVEAVDPIASSFTAVDRVTERVHIERNTRFDPALTGPAVTFGEGRWNKEHWEKWWWNQGYGVREGSRTVTFELPAHVTGSAGRVKLRLHGKSDSNHYVRLTLNGQAVPFQQWFGRTQRDVLLDAGANPSYLRAGSNELAILLDPADGPEDRTDEIHLAYLEAWHERYLRWSGTPFSFRSPPIDGVARYRLEGLPSVATLIYDVTDPVRPMLLAGGATGGGTGSSTLVFERTESAATQRRYHVAHSSTPLSPLSVELDTGPGGVYLKERTGAVDYIVVAADPFERAASSLAAFRDGFLPGVADPSVLQVRLSDVFDEFSGGLPDPSAVRRFLRFAYDTYRDPSKPATPRLRYATLIGDADFDHRDLATASGVDYLPAWTERFDGLLQNLGFPDPSWPSDDYFGLLEDAGSRNMWIALGRIPAASTAEAQTIVSKTIVHATGSDRSPWFQRALLSADDLCQGTQWDAAFFRQWTHTRQCERDLLPALPLEIEPVKVYLVDHPDPVRGLVCTGATKPTARDALIGEVNRGVFLVDYVGHGGETVMADERVLESADVPSMTNAGRYHYFVTASCTVGKFDDIAEGLGETILKLPGGGAVASLSAAAVAFSGSNISFNRKLLSELFRGGVAHPDSIVPFGDAFIIAKALEGAVTNTRKYNVLGDPAVELAWSDHTIDLSLGPAGAPRDRTARLVRPAAISLREHARTRGVADTLWRGEVMTIDGGVLNAAGDPLAGYAGVARVEVFDSAELRDRDPYRVLDNSQDSALVNPVDYLLPGAPIYRADVSVSSGRFSSTFFVPTGLRRGDRGPGRVRCYVRGDDGRDAFGTMRAIEIPDAVRGEHADVEPPVIIVEFGGPAQAIPVDSPLRIRLEDESGIYITQLLDSRAALLSFEDAGGFVVSLIDLSSQIVFGEDFRTVELEVPIPTSLEVGRPYVMKVRVSDNLGNRASTEEEIYLVVSDSPEVERVFVYPNPASREAAFFVDVNVAVEVRADIYTITGRRIRTLEATLQAGEGRTRPMAWNLRDRDGDPVANGSYLYVMDIAPTGGGAREQRTGWVAVTR